MVNVSLNKLEKLSFRVNEAYKTLRTNIRFSGRDIKVIALTSTIPNEGKTSVSMNLARCFAEDGKNVLLIDADIRKSVVAARYERNIEVPGLTHYLTGQAGINDIVCNINEVINLYMIFTGVSAPNPSELLGTDRFKQMIELMRENFDFVIIDCPPLGSVIDAAVVAESCDGAAIVVECDNVSYRMIQRTKEQLDKANVHILGAILNKVPVRTGKGYYGKYYGKYYGRYYGNYYGSYGDYGDSTADGSSGEYEDED
ncbi:MAG: CpsD/CapB family tyrosine-protein kinase [Lachnospiraceae bacterium]|nr:CpsD/CapB family tyrosine-protein kinase [Lachnospiraceae bacterium]